MWTNGWCLAVIDLQLCRRFYVFTTKQWVPKIDEKGTQNNCAEQFSAFLAYFIPHLFFFLFLVSCCLAQIVFSLSLLPKLLFVLSPFPSNKVIKVRLSLFPVLLSFLHNCHHSPILDGLANFKQSSSAFTIKIRVYIEWKVEYSPH